MSGRPGRSARLPLGGTEVVRRQLPSGAKEPPARPTAGEVIRASYRRFPQACAICDTIVQPGQNQCPSCRNVRCPHCGASATVGCEHLAYAQTRAKSHNIFEDPHFGDLPAEIVARLSDEGERLGGGETLQFDDLVFLILVIDLVDCREVGESHYGARTDVVDWAWYTLRPEVAKAAARGIFHRIRAGLEELARRDQHARRRALRLMDGGLAAAVTCPESEG